MPLHSPSPSDPEKCPNCGALLPEEAPQGLCPKCLFAGLAVPTEDGAGAAAPAPAQTPGELAPHFPQLEILECLGRGGMGVVYKARQKSLNRLVALKLLAPERVTDGKFAQRFTHEAQALAALNHSNIVTIHDFGQAGGFYFLLMEFVDGVNLRQAMKAGRFTPEQALAVVPPVCEALQYAHEHGIVHRDIKPENLLLDKEGRVKIADFGIAKMLGSDAETAVRDEGPQSGTLASAAGTPQYMAPEQKEHRGTDHRADIYSLGVVLYELLTGELPAGKLQPPSSRCRGVQIDVRLDEIVLRALEKTPELRYQTAGEFRTQVVTMTSGASVPPVEKSVSSRFSRTAIVGACWAALGLLATIWLMTIVGQHVGQWSSMTGPEKLGFVMTETLFVAGFLSTIGTTILGWIAVTQIRRSAGKLYGLGLAVFDGLLFPLLALDAVIGRVWIGFIGALIAHSTENGIAAERASNGDAVNLIINQLQHTTVTIALIATAFTALIVDFLIIRAVWRAVNKPVGGDASAGEAPPATSKRLVWGTAALVLAFAGLVVPLFFYQLAPPRYLATVFMAAIVVFLACEIVGLILGLCAWKTFVGKAAVIGTMSCLLIWTAYIARTWTEQGILLKSETGKSASAIEQALKKKIAEQGGGVMASAAFGPVIERVVVNMINLDSGELLDFPLPIQPGEADFARYDWLNGEDGPRPNKESHPWMRTHRIDAVDANNDLIGVDLRSVELDRSAWESLTPAALKDKVLAWPNPPPPIEGLRNSKDTGTYGFQTREGRMGILQVTDRNLPRGVGIRYKLVKPQRGPIAKGAMMIRNKHSVVVLHDDLVLHYVFYYAGVFGTFTEGTHETHPDPWTDEGSITLKENGRTFAYCRRSNERTHLRVNDKDYDLLQGRIFVLQDDGSVKQRSFEVSLQLASDPNALAAEIAKHDWGDPAKQEARPVFGPVIEREVVETIDFDSASLPIAFPNR